MPPRAGLSASNHPSPLPTVALKLWFPDHLKIPVFTLKSNLQWSAVFIKVDVYFWLINTCMELHIAILEIMELVK